MPHVALVPFTGFRIGEPAMLELGMSLPGLAQRAGAIGELPALGLLTLAGMLPDDWTCSYHPANNASADCTDALLQTLQEQRPTLVALSALTASVTQAYQLSRRLRAAGIRVVIGGLHATVCPDEAASNCDAVVLGDGENRWLDVLADAASGCLQRVYQPLAHRASVWPIPRFDLLGPGTPRYTLQTQRGCPLACEFCGASRLLGAFREKPAGDVQKELTAICQVDQRPLLELADDNTFAGTRNPAELLAVLKQSKSRWFTEADWRIGERPEVLNELAAAGCVQVLMGIESLVFRYPGMAHKQAELARIMDAVSAVQAAGVAVNGCFILGAEGESQASMQRLVEFVLDSPLAEVQITLQTPFPGTSLYRRLKRDRRLLPDRDWSHYTLFDVVFQPDILSVTELAAGFRRVVQQVFSATATARRTAIRRRIWRTGAMASN